MSQSGGGVARRRANALIVAALLAVASNLPAQRDSITTRAPRDSARTAGAAVVFNGDTLFTLYGNLGPFSAAARAAAVTADSARCGGRWRPAIRSS